MPEITLKSSPKKSGGWLRKLGWVAGILIALLIVVYFVATSQAFLKGVILPQVSKAIDADVTVNDSHISPFSQVLIHGLKVQAHGDEPLLTVQEIRASYNLRAIIGGKIVVSEVAVESPVITVIQNADGTSNLDPFTKKSATTTPPKPAPAKSTAPAKPLAVDIQKIALNNATVRLIKKYADGGQDITEVSGLNFTVSNLQNGASGKIMLAAALAVQKAAQSNAAAGALQADLKGGFDFTMTPDLKPASVTGNITFTVGSATGPLAQLNQFATTLDCDLTATELKQLALRFSRAGATLAEIRASGPFDAEKSEGKIHLEMTGIDKQALNLVGATSGMDFGPTTINSTNDIELSQGGNKISLAGRLDVANLQITKQGQTLPVFNVHEDYAVTVDQSASSATLTALNLNGTMNSQPLFQGGLSGPMAIAWGNTSNAVGDAAFNFNIPNLNLADLKAFTGDTGPEGTVNLKATLTSKNSGKDLAFTLDTKVNDLTTGSDSARADQGSIQLQASGGLVDLKQVKLDNYQLDLTRQGQPVLNASGSAAFDMATRDASLQVAVQTTLNRLLAKPDANATNDTINLNAQITSQQNKITLAGTLALSPTARATNQLQLAGDVDISNLSAITGNVKLTADALDITSYYDQLSAMKPAVAQTAPTPATSAPASNPNQEPAAVKLPLKNFVADLNIGHLFLREVDIANWQTTVLLDGGHVLVKPCQLTLNAAPINATVDLDLGVPGYTYDVAFRADAIPLTPLVNSFAPDRKGQIAGTTSANAQIKGAGITGTNLQKNLAGSFDFAATNMNLSIANVRSPLINGIINVVIGIPDLIKNPLAALGGMLGGSKKSGWADQLTASPIDTIALNAVAGDGKVTLSQAQVRSSAFQVLATGTVTLNPVLTNSAIQIPVQIQLSRSLGSQIGLVNSDTPTNAAYVPMPQLLTMQGTVGTPKTVLNKEALLLLAAKAGGGIGEGIGGATGQQAKSVFGAVEGLIGGKSNPSTNAASTNAAPAAGLMNLFKKLK